ncbi:MAG TPA: deoxyribose-phosphate aldolase [Candidatus Methylomirabilis sp.]|nr:deoxyribose-phosphate aldolase [Candidatus Methylomirabilis sp.]
MFSIDELAQMIDHSILLPSQTDQDLVEGIDIARKYRVRCVVPKAFQAARAKQLLQGSDVRLCIAIGFPQGLNLPEVKRYEAERVLEQGARELDMVINISALKSGQYDLVERDISGVVEVARRYEAPVKAILETCLLTNEEKVAACRIAERAGATFVKTSTATQPGGATVEDIRLMRATVGPRVVVKASGYVTDIEKVLALYEAGARRFGTGYTVNILEGLRKKLSEESRAVSRSA